MIRTAIGIGVLAIVLGIGIIVYRAVASGEDLATAGPGGPTPPALPDLPALPEPAPVRTAPTPAAEDPRVMPVANEERPAPPAPAPVQATPAPEAARETPASGMTTYKVKAGDSLWAISRKFYNSPNHIKQLADANNLGSNATLRIGQVLVIPDIRGSKNTPADADHETTEAPAEPVREPAREEHQPLPPTLSRTVPAK